MARTPRSQEFLFDPARFMNDPAVWAMSPLARGAYLILFCQGWFMPEPGVFPDDDAVLSHSARMDPESWDEVKEEVARAYDTASRPGFWVQRGTVATYEAQKLWHDKLVEDGRKGGLNRALKHGLKPPLKRPLKPPSSGASSNRLGVEGVDSESTEKDSGVAQIHAPETSPPNGQVQTVRKRTWNVNGRELEHGQAVTLADGRRATFCEAAGITALVLVEDGNRMRQERVRVREIQP